MSDTLDDALLMAKWYGRHARTEEARLRARQTELAYTILDHLEPGWRDELLGRPFVVPNDPGQLPELDVAHAHAVIRNFVQNRLI